MTKTIDTPSLEKVSKELELNEMFKEFFTNQEISNSHSYCKELEKYNSLHGGVSNLCSKLVGFLERIPQTIDGTMRNNYCEYLTYWMHDKVREIYTGTSEKTGDIPFFKGLIDVMDKVNDQIKENKCKIQYDYKISLDEWRNRKFSYIYLKKYNDIKKIINGEAIAKCNMYNTYLNKIKTLYTTYRINKCSGFWIFYSIPNYADCYSNHKPHELISILNNCKGKGHTAAIGANEGHLENGNAQVSGQHEKAKSQPVPGLEGLSSSSDLPRLSDSTGQSHSPGQQDTVGESHSPKPEETGYYLQVLSDSSKLTLEASGAEEPVDHRYSNYSQTGHYNPQENYDHHHAASTSILIPYEGITNFSNFVQRIYDILNSNKLRHVIMGASIVVVAIFLIFYFLVTKISILKDNNLLMILALSIYECNYE
ncbi:variable surface protein, partial [Plasmodium gonderi]